MYRVGFGDCFLLSFEYSAPLEDGRTVRHVLIDFGTTSLPAGQKSLLPIAKLIRAHTGGELDVVVVTHRHRDHLSGFASSDIANLLAKPGYPRLVVRSWTEDPAATADTHASGSSTAAVADRSRSFLGTLELAERFAERVAAKAPSVSPRSLAGNLHQLADDQLPNAAAFGQLERWAKQGEAEYLHYGLASGIEKLIPGLGIRVLGPPTIDQHPAVATQRSRDKDEFWMIYGGLVDGLSTQDLGAIRAGQPVTADSADDDAVSESGSSAEPGSLEARGKSEGFGEPGPVRWLTERMSRQRLNSLLRIVRILDDVLNNTSVILLFDVPGVRPLRLLFAGDAQIENWEYALKVAKDRQANLDLLREVDLYKVGHHGSRNATPRTLFNLWNEPATATRQMTALMSTKPNVHGDSVATAVPRSTLVAALDTRMDLYSTEKLSSAEPFYELEADLGTDAAFVKMAGPSGSSFGDAVRGTHSS